MSPPLVTPARANTPTEAKHSAALVRPQIVGGSLVTYSAVDDTPITQETRNDTHQIRHRRTVDEAARSVLSKGSRSLGPPPDALSVAVTASVVPVGEMRKGGRVHLQPLVKKTSR